MSRERARRRAERERLRAAAEAARVRREQRRARHRALVRRIMPPDRRRGWLLGRRSGGQRALVAGVALGALWLIWYLVPPLALRIGFSLLLVLLLPIFAILTFDRRV